jgi:hypothetical protein
MEILRRAIAPWRVRRAAEVESDIRAWHEACLVVLAACIKALQDPKLPRSDIGVTLDGVDRTLFCLRDSSSGARHALRRRDAGLGDRIGRVSEAIVELRNETARFLIRAQGPTPRFLQKQETAPGQAEAYQRALQDVGRAALGRSSEIERDLGQLWADLQPLLIRLGGSSTVT